MNRKYIFVSIFAFVFSFFFLTFGFCAFTSDLTINDVGVTVRQPLDVRVTNVTLNNSTGGASVENLDYNVRSVMSDITLPENSSITYNLEFTNYSNFSVYLLEITNLPDNLKYEIDVGKIDKYSLKDLFIENQYELKEITVTLSYKDNGYSSENECYSINLGFYFDTSYNVLFHSNNLPFEYQQVEYIESTGTQYIDTQVLSENNDLKFEIQYEIVKFSLQNQYVGIFGAYRSEQDNTTRLIYKSVTDTTGNALVYVNSIANGSALIDDTYRSTNIVYTDVIEKKHQTTFYTSNAFDGVKEKSDLVNGASYSDNIVIFNHSPNSHIYASMKLYYFKIYDAGGLIRYFIPCYRKSDGEIGLYDVVGNEFYTNKGSGSFIKGNNVSVFNSQKVLSGSTVSLNKNNFTFFSHKFIGWNSEPDGSGIAYKDEQKIYNIGYNNENVDLYAQWRPYQSEIVFYANGGMGTMNNMITPYGGNLMLSPNTFIRGGYKFSGWNTEADGSGISYVNESMINIDVSNGDETLYLYAQWSKKILPSMYSAIDYIESTGTQYIDTKVLSNNNNLKFELQYSLTKIPASNSYIGIFGAYTSETANTTRLIYKGVNGAGNPYAYINSKAGTDALIDETLRKVNVVYTDMIERKNNTTMYISDAFVGVKEKRNVSNGTEYSANIVIFNQSASSTIFSSMKLYYFRIYDNNQLIRYFIPCYRVSDNEVGLYDLVNDEFYSNKGTGTFIKGNDI